ncbi:MAG: phosphate/phosphite/phosphonate ABC transporter substrate-binding protein [Inhella sp.]|jgi:phosphonate transport system substrate-binding protein|uniref:phosphate/phosphite/phosphonate ABC transporter substrate-binding protein n=1 Tax=Inhella sp. TaxID=1921806 RepID=UPI0022C16363|nr:phosphate/phosphite/phosphonate ABC transporter substrate-binding protein [Inhella sp.]MCZ8233979.1 phosphate/phosphite/phosphonate ABC transporter substrate-binding protein [Inhella sp.]
MSLLRRSLAATLLSLPLLSLAQTDGAKPLVFGVGLFQPDREKNDATYRPLADHLAQRLGRTVQLRTVDSWEGLARSLASGETDIALLGPWGYVLAHHEAGAQAVATILYEGKPEYHALIVTHPGSGLRSAQDLIGPQGKGRTFAFGDKGSTSGYLIPLHFFLQQGVDPEKHFGRVLYTKHQAIETQVAAGQLDAGADYNRNRNAMIDQGLIKADQSRVIWQSPALPNDAVAVRAGLHTDRAFVQRLQSALTEVGPLLAVRPQLLPARYTGFVVADNGVYKPIRDAGLATGKLSPKR